MGRVGASLVKAPLHRGHVGDVDDEVVGLRRVGEF